MCLPIIGLGLSIAASFGQAMFTAQQAKQEARIEQEQLRTEIENERIKAVADTNDRLEQFRRDEAANFAALSTTGFDSLSYSEGIYPANLRTVKRDIGALEYNAGQVIGRKKYEIRAAGWRAKSAARGAWISAGADAIGKVGSYYTEGNSLTGGTRSGY